MAGPETERERTVASASGDREDDGLVIVDATRRVRLIDHRAREVLGSLFDLGDVAPALLLDAERLTLQGRGDGAEVVEFRVQPTRVDGAEGWAISVADVSSRRSPEEAAAELVAAVCHEMRTPLSAVVGYADVVRADWRELDDARRDRLLSVILRQGERLARLTEDLVALSRPGRGLDVRTEPVVLAHAVDEALSLLGPSEDVDVTGDGDVTVLVDAHHLQNILTNLVGNARKYGRAPIVVEMTRDDDAGLVRVHDAGPGVPDGFVSRMWDRFTRARPAGGPDEPEGSGLGLSVVAGLTAANGGRAWYEPGEPSGACFTVAFPLAAPPTPS